MILHGNSLYTGQQDALLTEFKTSELKVLLGIFIDAEIYEQRKQVNDIESWRTLIPMSERRHGLESWGGSIGVIGSQGLSFHFGLQVINNICTVN